MKNASQGTDGIMSDPRHSVTLPAGDQNRQASDQTNSADNNGVTLTYIT